MSNINIDTVLSSFNDRCTLLQYLKTIENKVDNFRSGTKFVIQTDTPDISDFIEHDIWLKPDNGQLYEAQMITGGASTLGWTLIATLNMEYAL